MKTVQVYNYPAKFTLTERAMLRELANLSNESMNSIIREAVRRFYEEVTKKKEVKENIGEETR